VNQADLIWMNGEYVAWEDAKVHVLTHGLHYGTGVFEGVRCYDTEIGPAVFRRRAIEAKICRVTHELAGKVAKRGGKLTFPAERLAKLNQEILESRQRMMKEGNFVYQPVPSGRPPDRYVF